MAVRAGRDEERASRWSSTPAPRRPRGVRAGGAQRRRRRRRDELRLSCGSAGPRFQESMSGCARELNDPTLKGVDKAEQAGAGAEDVRDDGFRPRPVPRRLDRAHGVPRVQDVGHQQGQELWRRAYRGQDIDTSRSGATPGRVRRDRATTTTACAWWSGTPSWRRAGGAARAEGAGVPDHPAGAGGDVCLNCGILALDGPTTNLDAPSADALARSLCDIMPRAATKENFQLIVITGAALRAGARAARARGLLLAHHQGRQPALAHRVREHLRVNRADGARRRRREEEERVFCDDERFDSTRTRSQSIARERSTFPTLSYITPNA